MQPVDGLRSGRGVGSTTVPPSCSDTSAVPARSRHTRAACERGALALIHCGLSAQDPQDVRKLPVKVNGFKPQNRRSQTHFGIPERAKGARGATF